PGHLGAKVEHYLKALPKEWRRELLPLAETARRVTRAVEQLARLRGGQDDLTAVLAEHLRDRLRRVIDPAFWADKPLPDHLRVRVRVVEEAGRELVASRDLAVVRTAVAEWRRAGSAAVAEEDPAAWRRARQQWERAPQDSWTFGDVPAEVPVVEQAG